MYLIVHENGNSIIVSELKDTDIVRAKEGVVTIFHVIADNYILQLNGDEFDLVNFSGPDRW